MFIIGNYMKSQGRLKHDTIVTTVMSNLGLNKAIEANGMKSVQTAVGDRHVVEEMRKDGYNIGGEQSGHVILFDHHNTGDGMLTGIQLLSVMAATGKKLSELAAPVQTYPQKLVNVPVTDKEAWKNYPAITDAIAKVEAKMAGTAACSSVLPGPRHCFALWRKPRQKSSLMGMWRRLWRWWKRKWDCKLIFTVLD